MTPVAELALFVNEMFSAGVVQALMSSPCSSVSLANAAVSASCWRAIYRVPPRTNRVADLPIAAPCSNSFLKAIANGACMRHRC